jgi:hypothetical protein
MQVTLVIITLAAALFYLGYRAYVLWWAKSDKGCDKCAIHKPMSTPEK